MATSKAAPPTLTGSCACGQVKFSTQATPGSTVYCYCTTCRKCSGSPYLPFVNFHPGDIVWTRRDGLEEFRKSDFATRTHCKQCGSCISMGYDRRPDNVGIVLGCIDEGLDQVEPVSKCIFVEEMPSWAETPAGVLAVKGFGD